MYASPRGSGWIFPASADISAAIEGPHSVNSAKLIAAVTSPRGVAFNRDKSRTPKQFTVSGRKRVTGEAYRVTAAGDCRRPLFDHNGAPPFGMKPNQNAHRTHFKGSRWQDAEPPEPGEVFGRILNCPGNPNRGNQTGETFLRADSEKLTTTRLLDRDISVRATVSLSFRTTHNYKSPWGQPAEHDCRSHNRILGSATSLRPEVTGDRCYGFGLGPLHPSEANLQDLANSNYGYSHSGSPRHSGLPRLPPRRVSPLNRIGRAVGASVISESQKSPPRADKDPRRPKMGGVPRDP